MIEFTGTERSTIRHAIDALQAAINRSARSPERLILIRLVGALVKLIA